MTIAHSPAEPFLRCTVTGDVGVDEVQRLLKEFAAYAKGEVRGNILVDLLQALGDLDLPGQFVFGAEMGNLLGAVDKVALVQHERKNGGFAARVARERGANVHIFLTEAAALTWFAEG